MRAIRVPREEAERGALVGRVLAEEPRGNTGAPVRKGRVLGATEVAALLSLPWTELHVVEIGADEVHEDAAGERIARAAAGANVTAREAGAGTWSLVGERRGLLEVATTALASVNSLDGPCVYTLYTGQVVDTGEVVARAKVTSFALPATRLEAAERTARGAGGLVRVRAFAPANIAAVVQETIDERGRGRFRAALAEKIAWLGSTLAEPIFVTPRRDVLATAIDDAVRGGADIVLVAGTRAMDPLDPAFDALTTLGATMVRHGVPAHPGSLLWLATLGTVPVLGMPTCGLFAQATTFDLVLPRLLVGERPDAAALAAMGHGGLLTRELAFRFPRYRAAARRGELDPAET